MNNLVDIVAKSLLPESRVRPTRHGVTVTTDCLYPSGKPVRVSITGGPETFVVSDFDNSDIIRSVRRKDLGAAILDVANTSKEFTCPLARTCLQGK